MHRGHESLLTLARKVHAAAVDDDVPRLGRATQQLSEALAVHLDNEAVAMLRLSPAEARVLRRGQLRLAVATQALSADAARGCPGPAGRCAPRAEELLALLALQAEDERFAGCDPAA